MKLATVAALAVLALTPWAAQAATFEVPLEGTFQYRAYWDGPCTLDLSPPSECLDGSLAGEFLTVTTPSAADGAYTTGLEISLSPGAAPMGFDFSSTAAVYDPEHPPFTVSVLGGRVVSIDGFYGAPDPSYWQLGFEETRLSYHGSSGEIGIDIEATLVPEPASGVLLLAGLVALVARRRSRQYH